MYWDLLVPYPRITSTNCLTISPASRRHANETVLTQPGSANGTKRIDGGAMARMHSGNSATPKLAWINCN